MKEEIPDISIEEYVSEFHVNSLCAKSILEFAKKKSHVFKDYNDLKTNGIDHWSKKKKRSDAARQKRRCFFFDRKLFC